MITTPPLPVFQPARLPCPTAVYPPAPGVVHFAPTSILSSRPKPSSLTIGTGLRITPAGGRLRPLSPEDSLASPAVVPCSFPLPPQFRGVATILPPDSGPRPARTNPFALSRRQAGPGIVPAARQYHRPPAPGRPRWQPSRAIGAPVPSRSARIGHIWRPPPLHALANLLTGGKFLCQIFCQMPPGGAPPSRPCHFHNPMRRFTF